MAGVCTRARVVRYDVRRHPHTSTVFTRIVLSLLGKALVTRRRNRAISAEKSSSQALAQVVQ